MTTYDDHHHKELQPESELNIFKPIAFFLSYEKAEKWLIKNGRNLTNKFYGIYAQPCAFCIITQKNYGDDNYFEDCMNEIDLYWCNRSYPTFVFTEDSYQMVMDENLIFCSHDWSTPISEWINYVKDDGTIFTGCTDENFEKCLEDYDSDYVEEYRKKYEKFKKNGRKYKINDDK